jgi:hypothetical protein
MPKLGRGPVGVVWCLHHRFDKAREKGLKAGVRWFPESSTPYRYLLPGEPTSGPGRKGRGSYMGRARKTKVKRASPGGLGGGYGCNLFIKSVLRRSVYWSTGRLLIYYRIGPSAIGLLINGAINFGLALFLVRVGLYIYNFLVTIHCQKWNDSWAL